VGDENPAVVNKRDMQMTNFWELSQVSTPRGENWYASQKIRVDQGPQYRFYYDGSSGEGQYVYIVEDGILDTHEVTTCLPT
jgi:hypothetical protein